MFLDCGPRLKKFRPSSLGSGIEIACPCGRSAVRLEPLGREVGEFSVARKPGVGADAPRTVYGPSPAVGHRPQKASAQLQKGAGLRFIAVGPTARRRRTRPNLKSLRRYLPDIEMSTDQQNEATESVMRVLYQAGVALSPDSIVATLDVYADDSHDEATVREALGGLEAESLVRRLDREGDYYVVTDSGSDFLETEIDQESLGFSG
jgi:hypothetical protein